MKEYAPDEMDVYMRTLEVAQINETDYFSYIIHEDMDEITKTIRVNHHFTEQAIIDLPAAQQFQYFITQMEGCHVHI